MLRSSWSARLSATRQERIRIPTLTLADEKIPVDGVGTVL